MPEKNNFLTNYIKSEIEELAESVADSYCVNGIVNPEVIAESEDISFTYGEYKDSFDGLLEHEYGTFHIYINTDRLEHAYTERARFTFAHELGHFYIDNHRNALAQGLINSHCSFTGFVSDKKMEREADYFASCLLLPKKRIEKDCFRKKFDIKLIKELSKKYQVSLTATALRFATIGNHPIMIVYSVDNSIKWYWRSDDFPFWVLKHGKDKIPNDTAMSEFYTMGTKYKSNETVYAENWFKMNFESDYDRQFCEHCIYGLDNSVLSIIWED
ncbi:MAG: ImmA/IrrE family metallo-endopeptidase [Flavobacteriaceae bacterium]|nr:ImmA/IrrE family metallo-endopeptidase [Flavobacteriaceae bacterium]